jgi:hypothetical protein
MTTPTRPRWKQQAGSVAIVVAAIALIVGPAAAYYVDRHADAEVAELDETGTDAALSMLRAMRDEAALNANATAARLDELARNLAAIDARLIEVERGAVEAARHELTELRQDASGANESAGVEAASVTSSAPAGDFDALAACESTGDTDGRPPHNIDPDPAGYHLTAFQFSPDTARKVGAYRGMPYAEQKAAAQEWASRVDPASRSGWPTCWPLVME